MVAKLQFGQWLLAQAAETTNNLPPPTKAAAMMSLLGILLLGMLFIVFVLIGGHWVRRLESHRRGPAVPPDRVLNPGDENPISIDTPKTTGTDLNEGDTMIPDDTQC